MRVSLVSTTQWVVIQDFSNDQVVAVRQQGNRYAVEYCHTLGGGYYEFNLLTPDSQKAVLEAVGTLTFLGHDVALPVNKRRVMPDVLNGWADLEAALPKTEW